MSRPRTALPTHVSARISKVVVVYAEGGNEYLYLKESKALDSFERGTRLAANALEAVLQNIKRDMSNEAINQIYWIVDGGDEHNQVKAFKDFYIKWYKAKDFDEGEDFYWSKLKILINHPCLEYWFLLHKSDPPCHSKTPEALLFKYDKRKMPSPCYTLQATSEYKNAFPDRQKGIEDRAFIVSLANDAKARKQAIARAKDLDAKKQHPSTSKSVLSHPCAEMYLLFEK
jgi:RloB-like protein